MYYYCDNYSNIKSVDTLKEPVVKIELGDKISEKPEDYVKANKTALKKTVLDLSRGRHGK